MCCDDDWEIRQPQDFVRGVPDTQIAPWLRPEPPNDFIPVTTYQPMYLYPITGITSMNIAPVFLDRTSPKVINNFKINQVTLG
jgi:hypothetical protein